MQIYGRFLNLQTFSQLFFQNLFEIKNIHTFALLNNQTKQRMGTDNKEDAKEKPSKKKPGNSNESALVIHQDNTPVVADPTPASLLRIAVENNMDIDKLERLMAMQQKWEEKEAKKSFYLAMSRLQKLVPPLEKTKQISFTTSKGKTNYKFAPLGEIDAHIKDPMFECGLSRRWEMGQENGAITCECIITHVDGHSEKTKMTGAKDESGGKNLMQQNASAITYLQRYTLIAALGLTTADEDNDGQGSSDESGSSEQQEQTQASTATAWLDERTPEWDEAEAKVRSGEWKVSDVEARWKLNKTTRPKFQEFEKQAANPKPAPQQQPVKKDEPNKEEAATPAPAAKKGKPQITKEHKEKYLELQKAGSLFKKGEVDDIVRVYNRSYTALATGDISLKTVTDVYELDPEVLTHLSEIAVRKV